MRKIEYISFSSNTGYAVAARNMILALKDHYDISIFPLDYNNNKKISGKDTVILNSLERKDDEERIQIFQCTPPIQKRRKKHKNVTIGLGMFETEDVPEHWIDILNKNTAIMCPSKFTEKTFSNSGIKVPIFYVPHCIDLKRYNPYVTPLQIHDKFVFMFIGTWRERKGYKELLKAWFEEFSDKDNVVLLIKTDKPNNAKKYINFMKQPNPAPIFVGSSILSEDLMPSYIKQADCLILPTKGEGFGLPPLQAMALGVPVIVTDYSGCTDYANKDTAFLLRPEGMIKQRQMDLIPQFVNKSWAYTSVYQIKKRMREVLGNKEKREEKIKYALQYVQERFGYDSALKYFDKMFSDLEL